MRLVELTLRNVGVNLVYYALTLGAGPWAFLSLEARWLGDHGGPQPAVRVTALLLGILSIGIQVWCTALLQTRGGGTPSPLIPTTHLVTAGPYAWVRNPVNLGEVGLFLALALWFASRTLLVYAGVAWLAFHLFIVIHEEPRHRRLFGASYAAYSRAVSRWLPRPPRAASLRPGAHGLS